HNQRLLGALSREGFEELGLNLEEDLALGRINSIDMLGLAITPDFNPYRFATYFYKINYKEKVKFTVDENEAQIAQWMKARDLLDLFDQGKILAVPPVIKVIETLGSDPFSKEVR